MIPLGQGQGAGLVWLRQGSGVDHYERPQKGILHRGILCIFTHIIRDTL